MRTYVRWALVAAGVLMMAKAMPRADEAMQSPGIFLLAPDEAGRPKPTQLRGIIVTDIHQTGMMKIMLTQGHAKGSAEGRLSNAAAAVRAPRGDVSFEFRFDESAGKPPAAPTTDFNEAMKLMGGERLPAEATSADAFVLVHFHVAKDSRSADLGSMTGAGNASISKDAVPFTSQAAGTRTFTVHPNAPLEPGEYGFYFNRNGKGFGGQFWDFGVDAK